MPVVTSKFRHSFLAQIAAIATLSAGLSIVSAIAGIACAVVLLHYLLYKNNPYSNRTFFDNPYETYIQDNSISYRQRYKLTVRGSYAASLWGYYVSGFLIIRNTLVGGKPTRAVTENAIIAEIHEQRFDPSKPYLISGDQFSVLYPRNMAVFYNQLLNPAIALSSTDWEHKQRVLLQSVLFAIDGLSASSDPRTTLVPVGPRQVALTQVHPGGVGSDQVYGLFYALDTLRTPAKSGSYVVQTVDAAALLCSDKHSQLQDIFDNYINRVQDKVTGLIIDDLHLASARDGVIRSSSFYDNVVLWKTRQLAQKLGLSDTSTISLAELRKSITENFWNEERGYYSDEQDGTSFSSDWLIGFPSGFFDLSNKLDVKRAEQTVAYIEQSTLVRPFPIKYQEQSSHKVPRFVKLAVPSYGGTAIWSYWGAEYITLLMHLYEQTGKKNYLESAIAYQQAYAAKIEQDRGFAETFDEDGNFLKTPLYKSIRITGWVVQYEYAVHLINRATSKR